MPNRKQQAYFSDWDKFDSAIGGDETLQHHLFAKWPAPGSHDSDKQRLLDQVSFYVHDFHFGRLLH